MEIQDIAQAIQESLEHGELKQYCQGGSFPPLQTFQNIFWGDFYQENGLRYEQGEQALDYLCEIGYLKQTGSGYNFEDK